MAVHDKYELGAQIGRGHFGIVRLCTERATGRTYAVKVLPRFVQRTNGTPRDDYGRLKKEVCWVGWM
jgi:serine/threonine protein kinase